VAWDSRFRRAGCFRRGACLDLQPICQAHDAAGNVKTIREVTNGGQKQCFSYDALDRLTLGFTGNDACTAYDGSRGSGVYTGTFA
jgi:YD repeat-containing protein